MALNDPTRGPWWRDAVTYQIYVRSFADSNGDGVGDLPGITARLPYLRDLGVDAVWITPFYPSPQHDHGYDVADYCDVDPLFGDLDAADELLKRARALGLKVIVDLVPNHTSSEHAWFQAALAAGPGSPERARYLFRDGRGEDGDQPPNNWISVFGGQAWTRVPDGQWYLHLFDSTQPDLDWRNPEVPALFEEVLRFWLDRGVDGFRVDVAHGLLKEADLPDAELPVNRPVNPGQDGLMVELPPGEEPMWDHPEVHEVYRHWRQVLDEYDGERMAVAEAWAANAEAMARYVRPDELHQTFNFHWLSTPWSAAAFAQVVTDTLSALAPVGAAATWVLSNHDVIRHPTRYGGGERGLARARAATLTMLGLPGSAYLYQGEELGLEEVEVDREHWQDPASLRTGAKGRDGCRVPVPWSGDAVPYGFSPTAGQPWIPQPDDWAALTVEAQWDRPGSTLEFYREALRARRTHALDAGSDIRIVDSPPDTLVIVRGALTIVLNCGAAPVPLPEGEVVVASGPVEDGKLPADTAVWLTTSR